MTTSLEPETVEIGADILSSKCIINQKVADKVKKNVISNIIKTVKITRLIKRIDLLKH